MSESGEGPGAVLIVPAAEKEKGGGHLIRCLFLLRALEQGGRETFLWIAEENKENVFLRFKDFFESSEYTRGIYAQDMSIRGFHARLLSRENELSLKAWDFIILDRFRTPADEFAFWSGLAPVVGIDEGGPCRSRFDFLIDLLPSLSKAEANLSAPGLLPLPRKRRPVTASLPAKGPGGLPLCVLISFGAEDSAGLGFLAARALSRTSAQKQGAASQPVITLIDPGWDYSTRKQKQLPGVKVLQILPNLKEHLAEYDLFITHFGLGVFEAVYARVPVLLVSPTAYHEKLSRNTGFFSLGIGAKAVRRLENFTLRRESLKKLGSRGAKIARRFGLEGEQEEDLGSFFGGLELRSPRNCPVCESLPRSYTAEEARVLGRFPDETYRRCKHCGMIYLSRLNAPPIEYGEDYFFEFYKKQYGKTYLEDFPNLMEMGRKRLKHIQAFLGLPKSNEEKPTLLDIGCAYGPFLAAAAECGFSPSGVDPAQDAVQYVNDELGLHAWQGFFPTGARAEDGPFDAVTLWYVIEHFKEPGKTLKYIHGILKNGGVLAFSTPSFSGISGRKRLGSACGGLFGSGISRSFLKNSPPDHWTIWSPRFCRRFLKQYGFRLCKIVVSGHHPERFPLLGRFAHPEKKGPLYRLLFFISSAFRLGDTFEAYAVKTH